MATDAGSITFIVPARASRGASGAASPVAGRALPGRVRDSVRVAALRAGGERQRLVARIGEDAVALHLAGGPVLVLHPENARDLLFAQAGAAQATRGADPAAAGEIEVPATLRWAGLEPLAATRGLALPEGAAVDAVEILTDLVRAPLADAAVEAIARHVDGQAGDAVYALEPGALAALKGRPACAAGSIGARADGGPLLVLAHGTFVDTESTFSKLWSEHPQGVQRLFEHYGGRVYALDHPTLGASPVRNALTLVQALASDQPLRLHLVTHSRGGLVAEVLARMAADPAAALADFDRLAALAGDWGEAARVLRPELQALADALAQRRVSVERVVRVACPARGTLLASRRLDAYVSVLKWGLELAAIPVAPTLVDFLGEVARRRENWLQLPGLAAMTPDNPLVQWLNLSDATIPGELRVVAGDLQGDSLGSWVKTLLADAFYWTDNDIVVQTRSMYGGTPRAGGASFLLDRGGKVTHFDYFRNRRTADAVVQGLTETRPDGFGPIGPLSWAGRDAGGVRGTAATPRADGRPAAELPAVFVLPGILGSHLKVDGHRIWLGPHFLGGLPLLKYDPDTPDRVQPDGPVGDVYDDLVQYLELTHQVIPFGYDWRRPLEDEARRLADAVTQALDARAASGQPVRLLAHSMGGLLARTLQLERPEVWQRLMERPGSRLLMLGTPNGGSWSPMQVLSGDDTFGNAMAAFGLPLRDHQARTLMAGFPGFLQLQAGLVDDPRDLGNAATWKTIAQRDLDAARRFNAWHQPSDGWDERVPAYEWGLPTQAVLDRAAALRRRLDTQVHEALPAVADRLLLVTGHAKFTPDGYEWRDSGLVYLDAVDGGDGRVPLPSALLPGVRTWTLDCEHGALPSRADAFEAYVDLLERGDTGRLSPLAPATRGAATHVRSRPARGSAADALPAGGPASVFLRPAAAAETSAPRGPAALRVTVHNGNLCFVRQPLLVGHYDSLRLEGTERAVDRLIGGAMSQALALGLYPNLRGSCQVFLNPAPPADSGTLVPRPEAVVVVGLGAEGALSTDQLASSVRQGVLAWAQRLVEGNGPAGGFELAATLLGSGGLGVSPGGAARAIVQGVRDANALLVRNRWPSVQRLTLVELFLERAAEAWKGLRVQATAAPGTLELDATIASGLGALRRSLDAYRGADYDFIRITSADAGFIDFTLDSHRARSEVRARKTQRALIAEIVACAARDDNDDPRLGRTLYQLLVPVELEPFLGGTTSTVLEVDRATAGIPWELLDAPQPAHPGGDPRPWAIRSRLLRKLRSTNYRERVVDANADDAVLIVGEPSCAPKAYPRLPGARAEAQAVEALFSGPGGVGAERINALIATEQGGQDALPIVNALLDQRYRIVHISGHGEPGEAGGVVLSGGTVLGAAEIEAMRTVPELVFVNCCHLAAQDARDLLAAPSFDRTRFAATVAEALIDIGVRCVIAAGWAVEDEPAQLFATTLYRALLAGEPFVEAVARARLAAWQAGGNTWAAYQCYGDPDWTFRPRTGDAQAAPGVNEALGEEISSPVGLALALEEIATDAKFGSPDGQGGRAEHLRRLEARFQSLWGGMGAVAEAFAVAWSENGERERAIGWYERALAANDGSASLRAAEQLANLRARQAWGELERAAREAAAAPPARGRRGARATAPGREALEAARTTLAGAVEQLERLLALQRTVERWSLLGSAHKRRVMLERLAGDAAAERAALQAMHAAYGAAEALAREQHHDELYYPGANRLAAEIALHAAEGDWDGPDGTGWTEVRQSLEKRMAEQPEFWAAAGLVELDVMQALGRGDDPDAGLAGRLAAIRSRYEDLHSRVPGARHWGSVADQADFLVLPWMRHRGPATQAAAEALLAQLRGYAQR
ncbi:MAG: CHAT domain-containing protein [Rubrivivax sp.]